MHNVEYFEDTHEYLIDGVIVPSVSVLVAYATGNIYNDIPESILKKAREHGTAVHDAIEEFEKTGKEDQDHSEELNAYKELKAKYMLEVKDMEQIVAYDTHFCGRYDIKDIDGTLWDIKTTSKIHTENLEWQLGLYYLGLGVEKDIGYCLHIPKKKYGKPKVKLIKPKTNAECIELIKTYEQANESTTNTTESKEPSVG